MPDAPRITVALPTCNGARHLRAALAGVLEQQEAAFDLVVSDDRSDDNTLDIVRDVAGDRARVSVNSERLGLAGNWDRCVALSRTRFVAIFHQDDVMRPGHLAAHLRAFASDPTLGFVASAADVIDGDGRPVPESVVGRGGCGPVDRVFPPGTFISCLAVRNPLRCSGVTINGEAHALVGGFDPKFHYVVDWDFWLRVARSRGVAWLAASSVAIRWHPSSETHRFRTGSADLDETARLLDDIHAPGRLGLPDSRHLRRQARRVLARAFLNRSYTASKSGDPALARLCLARSLGLDPGLIGTIAVDPRLAARLIGSALIPGWLARLHRH